MGKDTVAKAIIEKALLALFEEAYVGPPDPRGTWFTDNEPRCGFLGTIEKLDATAASSPLFPGDPLSAASHAGHIRYALHLTNLAMRGENPYPDADWKGSWATGEVDEAGWKVLVSEVAKEIEDLREAFASGMVKWDDEVITTGTLAAILHGAWHLGAIRQGLGLVTAPAP
jgi:hypothetical protein